MFFSIRLEADRMFRPVLAIVKARPPDRGLAEDLTGVAQGEVQQFIGQGFLLFQAPTDMGFIAAGAKRYLEPLEKSRRES